MPHGGKYLKALDGILESKKILDAEEENSKDSKFQPGEWWDSAWVPFLDDASNSLTVIDTGGEFFRGKRADY